MKTRRSHFSKVGAVALTLAAGASALVVNAGILRQPADAGVGTLTPDQAAVAAVQAPSTVRYVTIYVDDLPTVSPSPATAASQFATTPAAADSRDHEHERFEYEGAEDDD